MGFFSFLSTADSENSTLSAQWNASCALIFQGFLFVLFGLGFLCRVEKYAFFVFISYLSILYRKR